MNTTTPRSRFPTKAAFVKWLHTNPDTWFGIEDCNCPLAVMTGWKVLDCVTVLIPSETDRPIARDMPWWAQQFVLEWDIRAAMLRVTGGYSADAFTCFSDP